MEATRAVNQASVGPKPARGVAASTLTPREVETLEAIACGKPQKVVAVELGICESAVKMRLSCARSRMGARNVFHLLALALERGLILGPEGRRREDAQKGDPGA